VHKREKDLVAATQGRSFWVLDDTTVLHQVADASKVDAYLFKPEDPYRMPGGGGFLPRDATVGQNPPAGAVIYYRLKSKPSSDLTIEILDGSGKSVRQFTSKAPDSQGAAAQPSGEGGFGGGAASRAPAEPGLNRFVWDLRYQEATRFPGMILWSGETRGPRASPGSYQVKLTVDGKTLVQNFEVKKDPRIATTPEEFAKQFDLLTKIRDKFNETTHAVVQIRDVRKQLDDVTNRVKDQPSGKAIGDAAQSVKAKLASVEEALYQTKNQSSQDPLNYPIRLNNKLAALAGVVAEADAAPTDQALIVFAELGAKVDDQLQKLAAIIRTDLPAFNKLVRDQDVPAVFVRAKTSAN
jgi:hypothetical protein